MYTLSTPVEDIKGVGPTITSHLLSLGIITVKDLVYHVPFRYEHLLGTKTIGDAPLEELVSIKGTVISITKFNSKRGLRIIKAVITDETDKLQLMWFNQDYILLTLKKGEAKVFTGKIKLFKEKKTMTNPTISQVVDDGQVLEKFIPIYPSSEGVSAKKLHTLICHVLENLSEIEDVHPQDFLSKHNLPPLNTTLRSLHNPSDPDHVDQFTHRLAFDEVYSLLLEAKKRKVKQQKTKGFSLTLTPKDVKEFEKHLPYALTSSQTKTLFDLSLDVTKPYPCNRLIQGEVGSGKTTVAAFALFVAALNHTDGVLLAPTQIVAHQHFETLKNIFTPMNISVKEVLSGSTLDTNNREVGTIYVGTHALFSHKKTILPSVVVVDEEHRFGVNQRDTFLQIKRVPHLITMTATPIPRTSALTVYADRDISFLEEIPEKKKNISTKVIPESKRQDAYTWIDEEIEEKHAQVFIVCPFISESNKENLESVASSEKMFEDIKRRFPKRTVKLLHGRMTKEEKETTFDAMRNGNVDILVATPLIEVGIDIPNASIMLIEGAERFGLSQLHQLRGRVGRAGQKAYCFLFTTGDKEATKRLKYLEKYTDGNTLSEMDLHLRGTGDLFGSRQHGWDGLKFATLFDKKLIEEVKEIIDKQI